MAKNFHIFTIFGQKYPLFPKWTSHFWKKIQMDWSFCENFHLKSFSHRRKKNNRIRTLKIHISIEGKRPLNQRWAGIDSFRFIPFRSVPFHIHKNHSIQRQFEWNGTEWNRLKTERIRIVIKSKWNEPERIETEQNETEWIESNIF